MTRLAIASDHGGYHLKATLFEALKKWGFEVEDFGTHSTASCDYPDFAHSVALAIEERRVDLGILVCGSGVGMCITANKHAGVRAALVSEPYSARMSREHNDANVLCLGERVVGSGLALEILRTWLDSSPDPAPRHAKRIAKIEHGAGGSSA